MNGTVIVRLEPVKTAGNITHDLDNERRPKYVDKTKSKLNKIIYGKEYTQSKQAFRDQQQSIINHFNRSKTQQRKDYRLLFLSPKNSARERRNIRNWQSHMNTHLSGFIGFGTDAQANDLNREEMDKCAQEYVNDLCLRHNIEILYLVRHEDESTTHYHFLTTNYDEARSQTLKLQRDDLRKEQDAIGSAFQSMGLSRGIDKQKRLKDVSDKLKVPMVNGRYSENVWEKANVIHRSVKRLHEELPLELYIRQEELAFVESSLAAQKAKLDKNIDLIEKSEERLALLSIEQNDFEAESEKLKKCINTYHKSVTDAKAEIDRLSLEFSPPKKSIIEHVSGYTKKQFGKDEPIIKKIEVVMPKNAFENFKIVAAKEKELEQENARLKQLHQKQNEKRLQDEDELQAFFNEQAFKHLLVFGKPLESNEEIQDFIKWFDQNTGWTTTKIGTRFKVQKQDGEIIRIVVERSTINSAAQKAETLLYAARHSNMRSGGFTGSIDVLIELWKQNQSQAVPFDLKLTDQQKSILKKESLLPGEPHTSAHPPLERLPS